MDTTIEHSDCANNKTAIGGRTSVPFAGVALEGLHHVSAITADAPLESLGRALSAITDPRAPA
jgi:hypothetical protein